jgi:putative FmdB family regulatory protein
MPNYQRSCTECQHSFVEFSSMEERHNPVVCPQCGGLANTIISAPAVQKHNMPLGSKRFSEFKEQRKIESALREVESKSEKKYLKKVQKEFLNGGKKA